MVKHQLKQKALELRKLGKSYSQIKEELGVSKSTLSFWLSPYPLSRQQIRLLRDVSEVRIEKFRQTMQEKREKRFSGFYREEKEKILPLSQKELFIAGLFLYWGEGMKNLKYPFALYNTNPQLVKFGLFWIKKVLNVPSKKIKVILHLYSDMDINKEIKFWAGELKMPILQFSKPYIKESKKTDINRKGAFGHGTCGLVIHDVLLKEKVMAALKAVADYYENRI
ncbi:MAG: hypothetical protein COT92_01150 [Candidatus Doudnabacteria bacterium CG10_big_fil_rev_8_21_14_0_10_42_18]|uniref:Uncharacterized protein n=1 Tax=Candidatus Doudnabacteria bacterium CG10_big_fil_rev_8_21_14_0_10_42_18 TaxID=1974552 RepID=A0A2H0VDK5_9BACT|nr:MAG: hypothetical protein COT92_01150 [Candidatus Doudnabacteria bacterium CG10_big_fil_rev_8_21_14_0_10_42_18]